jgi:drug/metabolite transporter (DMT)-like permease
LNRQIWLALLAVYIIWGSTYLGIRFVVETIPPFMSGGVRFLVSGLLLYGWRRLAGDPAPTRSQWKSAAIVGLFLLLGGNGLLSWSEQTIPSGVASLLIGATPMMLVVLEALRPGGVRPGWVQILGLGIGFGGIALLVGPSDFGSQQQFDWMGVVGCLLAAFLWAIGSIYSRSADFPPSAMLFTGMEMLAGSAGLLIASALLGEWAGFRLEEVAPRSLYGLVYLVAFGSLIGFVSYGWLLRNAPVSLVATYAYVNPLVAILLGAWLGGEVLNFRILASGLVIIASVALINYSRQARMKPVKPVGVPADD